MLKGITLADLGIHSSSSSSSSGTSMIVIESLTDDSRRVRRQFLPAEPPPPPAPSLPLAPTGDMANKSHGIHLDPMPEDDLVVDLSQYVKKTSRKRYQKSVSGYSCFSCSMIDTYLQDHPLLSWMTEHRDGVLRALMTVEGRSNADTAHCQACPEGSDPVVAEFVCEDCFSRELICAGCCVRDHCNKPLDSIKVSGYRYFLQKLGTDNHAAVERLFF